MTTRMRKVLIESDGSPQGTFLYDMTGHKVRGNITKIEWWIDPQSLAKARVTFENVELFAPANGTIETEDSLN
jgi:hypothetical protein